MSDDLRKFDAIADYQAKIRGETPLPITAIDVFNAAIDREKAKASQISGDCRIEIDPGESLRISRSRDGKILIIEQEDGTRLVQIEDDRVIVTIEDSDGATWKSPYETAEHFWDVVARNSRPWRP